MAKKTKTSKFRGKVAENAQASKTSKAYGYLRLPKGVHVYSPTPGARESFDIIPYEVTDAKHPDKIAVGELWYKRPFLTHRGIGADNDAVVCLQSFGEKCPICEYRKKRAAEGADKDELKAWNASKRNLYYVIPRGIKKTEEEPHVFDFSAFSFQDMLNDEILENEDYQVFPDFEEGLTLKVRWNEETFAGNKFAQAGRIDFIERKEEIDSDVLAELPSLDEILVKLSYAELNAKFLELDQSSDDDDDQPVRKKGNKPEPKKATKKVEEDEEEDEDEEEEKPIRNKKQVPAKSGKKAPVIEEDEEEDEEEEEEVPAKSKKAAPATSKKASKKAAPAVTWDDLVGMELSELVEVAESEGIDVDDYVEEDEDEEVNNSKLRTIIAEQLGIEIPVKKVIKKGKDAKPEPAKKGNKVPTCPAGGTFGEDSDLYDECESCPLYKKCASGLPF